MLRTDSINNLNIPLVNTMINNLSNNNSQQMLNRSIQLKEETLIKNFSNDIREREDLIKNFESISKDLIIMGFHPRQVLHSFLAFQYKRIEEGVELLSRGNDGMWNHRYIESDESRCFVCDSYENEHRSLSKIAQPQPIDLNQLEKRKSLTRMVSANLVVFPSSENEFSLKINVKSCQICFLEIEVNQKFNLKCQHQFCRECIIEYLKEEIKNSRVSHIKCPTVNCSEMFADDTIKNLLPADYFYKYQKFLQRAKIKDDDTLIVCPIVDCEGYSKKNESISPPLEMENSMIKKEDVLLNVEATGRKKSFSGKRKYVCSQGHSFCSQCSQAWHGDTPCDEDKEIKDFATYSGFILKKCPSCKVWTEKNEGCNHMTCKICSYNWCWLCELECKPDHYMQEGSPCFGKQFNYQTEEEIQFVMAIQNGNSILRCFFFVYILTFFMMGAAIRQIYTRRNENDHRPRPPKIICFLSLLCVNGLLLLIQLFFNGHILLCMMINLTALETIRNPCVKCIILLTYLILYFQFFIIGGSLLSMLWFVVTNFYVIYKLCRI